MALWKSQMEDHTSDWFRVVLISSLGQTMNGKTYRCVLCYRLGVPLFSVSKACSACSMVFTGDINGDHVVSCAGVIGIKHRHNVVLDTLVDICYRSGISAGKEVDIGLDGRRDVCMDLIGSSPLTQTGMADFVPGRAVIDAAQRKRVKYEAKWSASFNQPKNQKSGLVEPKSSPVMVFTCEGRLHLNFTRDGKTWSKDSDKPKSNNVAGPSVVNMVEHNNSSRYNDNKGKCKHHDNTKVDPNKKAKATCWKCDETGHIKRDCKGVAVGNKANGSGIKGSDDDVAWWVDSGATIHVYKDRYLFKTYESLNDGSILHMGNESTALVHGRGYVDLRLNIVNDNIGSAFMSTSKLIDSILWNKKYFVTFIDDASRFCYVYLLHSKEEALDKFKVFKTKVELQQGSLIKRFRTDMGVAFNSIIESMDAIFDENRFFSVPRPNLMIPNGTEDIGGLVVPEEVTEDLLLYGKKAINDEMDSIMGNNTWVLADLPPGCKPLGCKWIFKRKLKVDGTIEKFKAMLVIQGFKQKSGIDYFDTYALVVCINIIRPLIAMASIHNLIIHHMDVKMAFLNGELDEEVYMNQPRGFIMPGNENKVCKLIKSLYGLKQAPKQWHQKFDEVVLSNDYLLDQADKCVYSKFDESGKGVIICLCVDNMLIFGTNQVQVDLIKEFLSSRFSMKDMGEADVILCIRIKHESNGIAISQSHYIKKVLKKFNYFDCTTLSTHMDTSEKLMPNKGQVVSQLEYSRVIGCLMYAMNCTRPNIAIIVGKLSRYNSNPVLEGYTDANWLSNTKDNSSTSGWVFLLEGGAISWASKKQTCITGSTMESEFVALAATCKEAE
nr:zinc finger, CCHC-type [Tanacetum cinerariifolium]